ncbi:MAG: GNAT family N-acetyltransferase [Cyclobacteriaceae bacterium]
MIYYSDHYLINQNYSNLLKIETHQFFICFNILKNQAVSISQAPFGGIMTKAEYSNEDLSKFIENMKAKLRANGVNSISIIQPPAYYDQFVPLKQMLNHNFESSMEEVNQYVNLNHREIHVMEKRILAKETSLHIEVREDFETAHYFIAKCRREQGLTINISEEKLLNLVKSTHGKYKLYTATYDRKWAAAVITVDATEDIRYYYLPATSQSMKKMHPMVYLLDKIYYDAQNDGLKYLDLGKSSIKGEIQAGLHTFKKRMGAADSTVTELRAEIQ